MSWFRLKRGYRFILIGGANTLFGFLAYSLVALSDLPTWLVLVISNIFSISFSFFTSSSLVFRKLGTSIIPRFVFAYMITFVMYWKLIEWLTPTFGGRIVAMAIIVIPMALLSYFLQSKFVFNAGHVE